MLDLLCSQLMRLSQSLLSANIQGMYRRFSCRCRVGLNYSFMSGDLTGLCLCMINPKARRSAVWIATKCFLFWTINTPYLDGIWSTVAEWHFIWSRHSTTEPPRLDFYLKIVFFLYYFVEQPSLKLIDHCTCAVATKPFLADPLPVLAPKWRVCMPYILPENLGVGWVDCPGFIVEWYGSPILADAKRTCA